MTDTITIPRALYERALEAPGCERIKDFYAVGPVQRAAVESFAEAIRSALEQPQQNTKGVNLDGGCTLSGPGRGDCEHAVGLPGNSIPGQHDGPDDTVDAYGKPNGWCWSCWKSHRIKELEAALEQPQQGPVAWRAWNDHDGFTYWDSKDEAELNTDEDFPVEPLVVWQQQEGANASKP